MADIVIKNEKGATATMVNPTTGKRVAVIAGGDYSKSLFGSGFFLEGKGGKAVGYTPPNSNNDIINQHQQGDFNSNGGAPTTPYDQPINNLFAGIGNLTSPTPYNASETYKNFLGDKSDTNPTGLGITALETQLGDLTTQEQGIQAEARSRRHANEGQPVALGVISGRQSEIDRQTQDQLESIALQKAPIVAALQTKYQTVNTMMGLMQTDYQNAVEHYNTQFTQATQAIETLRGLRSDQMTAAEQSASHASANLTVIMQGIKDGSYTYASLDPSTKANITKLETQAGLPIGFTARLHSTNPNADILGTTTRTDASGKQYADVMMRDKNGKITVQHVLLGGVKGTGGGSGRASVGGDTGVPVEKMTTAQLAADYNLSINGLDGVVEVKGDQPKGTIEADIPGTQYKAGKPLTREAAAAQIFVYYKGRVAKSKILNDIYKMYPTNYYK